MRNGWISYLQSIEEGNANDGNRDKKGYGVSRQARAREVQGAVFGRVPECAKGECSGKEKKRENEGRKMNEQTTHTPTPWAAHDNAIWNADSETVTNVNSVRFDDFANAAHIVKCVNAHDGLVKALRFIANVACGERQCKSEAICSLRAAGIEVTP